MRGLLPTDTARLQRFAATASLSLATLLALLKLAAAVATGSLAVLSSLIDSLADIVASAITFVAVQISQQPPDRGHRFGHGKAESLSAMAQAALVAGSAIFVLIDAARSLGDPRARGIDLARHRGHGLRDRRDARAGLVPASGRATDGLPGDQRRQRPLPRRPADQPSIIASLVITQRFGWLWLDPVIGAAMAIYLGWHAYGIGREAVKVLMDHELPPETRQRIKEIVLAHPEVQGLHDLRTREFGGYPVHRASHRARRRHERQRGA